MTWTPTDHRPHESTRRSASDPPRPPGGPTSNPVRIGRIGADHIQVSIRPALDDGELLIVVHRLEQLIDAGYEAIDVVFEERDVTHQPSPS